MMTKQLVGALGIVLGFVAFQACSASDSASGGTTGQGGAGGQVGICTPGAQVSCACPGGTTGVQICLPSGQGYGTCDCSGAGASGGYDPCGDDFCDQGSDENCRSCQQDCGTCAPCDIAPSCEHAQIAPAELVHATDLDSPATRVSRAELEAFLAEQVAVATPAMRVVAAALAPEPAANEPHVVARVRQAFADHPAAAARVRDALAKAGLDSPARYRERFPVAPAAPAASLEDGAEQTFTPMADEFPGGTVECGSPFLRVGVFRIVVHDDQDGWAQGSNDEIYCLIEGESEGGYEIRVTPLVTIESGAEKLFSNEAGVFWGTEGPKTPGDDLLITYNCIESDDSAAYQALIESIGDGAGQVGDVYEGSYGWVFPTVDGVSGVVSAAMAANGDDKVFNVQQQIPLDRQLALTNGEYWSIRRDDFDGDWEVFVRAWGCAEFGLLD